MKKLKAKKIGGYLLEPLFDKIGATWQAHHVTNPAVFRPSFDDRVFLGYRAGGDRDHYCINNTDVWSSSLGLAILDEYGKKVLYRFPYPIMKVKRTHSLPQSKEEYDEYIKDYDKNEITVLHDFRLYEKDSFIYVIYHDGRIGKAFDCIKKMPVEEFKAKVNLSIELIDGGDFISTFQWEKIWNNDIWQNAGIEGTRLVYPTDNAKNDIIFYSLGNGKLEMIHRPLPDMAVVDTKGKLYNHLTIDGYSDTGNLEACVRPGYFDNSHIGANGMPTVAFIGERKVYIDVCHGVHNEALTRDGEFTWDMIYLPYFRVKDFETGELLYYSEEPILDLDEVWREYTENGRWIKLIPHKGIMFAGGQIEMNKGKNGLDDKFTFYTGVGDTAITRAEFTIRQLLPDDVIEDIMHKAQHDENKVSINENKYELKEKVSGWTWHIYNSQKNNSIIIERSLEKNGLVDISKKHINKAPGYFDADCMIFDGQSIKFVEDIGWCLIYKGIRWIEEDNCKKSCIGYGMLVFDNDNLERILYRSTQPFDGKIDVEEGWTTGEKIDKGHMYIDEVEKYIPNQVKFELKRSYDLINEGKHWKSHHTIWLQKRSGRN